MVRRLVVLFILFSVNIVHSEVLVMKDYWMLSSGHQCVFSNALTRTVVADDSEYGDLFRIDQTEDGSVDRYYQDYDASGNLYYYGKKRSNDTFFDYTPAFKLFPSGIEVGTTYTVSTSREEYDRNGRKLGTGTDDLRITVTGPESVTVPAGTFTAYKIQMVDNWRDKWSNNYGTSTLTYWVVKYLGIVKIETPDQIYKLSSSTKLTQQLVTEIYVATFERAPANSGLNYWTNAVDSGSFTIEQVAQSFFDQPETKEKFPEGSSNSDFIITVYYNVLNRAPEAAGLAYWVDALDRGAMRRDQAIMAIIKGAKAATGSSEDAAMLAKKTEIGILFANSEVGGLTANENFMEWSSNIINFANSDDFNVEAADKYIAELSITESYIWYKDSDEDGYSNGESRNEYIRPGDDYYLSTELTAAQGDCDDNDDNVHPGAKEICDNDIDDDCDGKIDEDCTPDSGECGAYIAPGVWKAFECYNLAAIGKTTGDDPFTPSWRLIGGYWQWGWKGPDESEWYDTNTSNFAHGPTGPDPADANDDEINGWGWEDTSYADDGAWSDDEKTANDPCPSGYRVPTIAQWKGVCDNNDLITVGTWTDIATNYSSAKFFGDDLMLPTAGNRRCSVLEGELESRGREAHYWSSTINPGTYMAHTLTFTSTWATVYHICNYRFGYSVRCIAE